MQQTLILATPQGPADAAVPPELRLLLLREH
jgi:hypothetical protein